MGCEIFTLRKIFEFQTIFEFEVTYGFETIIEVIFSVMSYYNLNHLFCIVKPMVMRNVLEMSPNARVNGHIRKQHFFDFVKMSQKNHVITLSHITILGVGLISF